FEPVHFNCGGLFLALLSGSLVCLDLKPMERSTTHLYHCLVEAEKQEDTTWVMSNGQVLVAEPSCSVNSRAALNCLVLMLASDVYQEELEADI
ncbi:MAG TPA: hypothetical protein VN804_05230, partial [Solirubrobacteraceae bacterium]|nr:hypothetical protein [Solirubrobacteraceae bacterium]